MGLLEQAIVSKLLALTSREKQYELEGRIVALIGGSTKKIVNRLPRRRGGADGGIDGRVKVIRVEPGSSQAAPADDSPLSDAVVEAGINVRVEKAPFSRADLGAFWLDLDREELTVGIMVTAAGLAADAESEVRRLNKQGDITLVHLPIQNILSRDIEIPCIRFANGDLCETIRSNLEEFVQAQAREEGASARV